MSFKKLREHVRTHKFFLFFFVQSGDQEQIDFPTSDGGSSKSLIPRVGWRS